MSMDLNEGVQAAIASYLASLKNATTLAVQAEKLAISQLIDLITKSKAGHESAPSKLKKRGRLKAPTKMQPSHETVDENVLVAEVC